MLSYRFGNSRLFKGYLLFKENNAWKASHLNALDRQLKLIKLLLLRCKD